MYNFGVFIGCTILLDCLLWFVLSVLFDACGDSVWERINKRELNRRALRCGFEAVS